MAIFTREELDICERFISYGMGQVYEPGRFNDFYNVGMESIARLKKSLVVSERVSNKLRGSSKKK